MKTIKVYLGEYEDITIHVDDVPRKDDVLYFNAYWVVAEVIRAYHAPIKGGLYFEEAVTIHCIRK